MKKRVISLLLLLSLCISLSVPGFAASEPAIEIVDTYFRRNSVGGVSPTIEYCNNSSKTIKYIYFYMTPYNAVDDPVKCTISGSSQMIGKLTGPIKPSEPIATQGSLLLDKYGDLDDSSPFKKYMNTHYSINSGLNSSGRPYSHYIRADQHGNYFVYDYVNHGNGYVYEYTYLTENEVSNYVYKECSATFDCMWYNGTITKFKVTKAIVEFMDGTKETVSGSKLYGSKYNHVLENKPFLTTVSQYADVYNYKDYMAYNTDLAETFGDNQKALFEHFITYGMKDGRQASADFDLNAYKTNNPDLVEAFGDDNVKYYEHYISNGKAEGRKATQDTSLAE